MGKCSWWPGGVLWANAAGGLEGFYGQMQLVAWRGFMDKCSWWPGGVLWANAAGGLEGFYVGPYLLVTLEGFYVGPYLLVTLEGLCRTPQLVWRGFM